MASVRESWTDKRLDDLNAKVDRGFDRVDTDIRELRGEMNSRFDALQRTMILGFSGIAASVAGAVLVVQL